MGYLLALLLFTPFWGPTGHRVVARVAEARLSPAALAEAKRLLGGKSLADISSWADEVRPSRPATGPWHYVDIEIYDTSYVPSRDCKDDACVISAIAAEATILADKKRSSTERAEALMFVVHFIGDVHQPLHGGERNDKGGNSVRVTYDGKQTNLHSLWDSGLLTALGKSEDDLVREINDQIATRSDIKTIGGGNPTQWAMESHDISRDVVYKLLPQSLVLDASYLDAARPVLYERLLRAGVRLAAVLNYALTAGAP